MQAMWLVLAVVVAVLLLSGTNVNELNAMEPGALEQSRFYRSCVGHSTAAACSCILSGGGCGCLVDGFRADPEWEAFREMRCDNKPASANRLLYSYAPANCPFAPDQCASPSCATGLAEIEQEIQDVANMSPGDAVHSAYCLMSNYTPEVVPGSKIRLSGPLPFEMMRVFAVVGLVLGLALSVGRASGPLVGAESRGRAVFQKSESAA